MAYVDRILEPGEELLYRTRTHWVAFTGPALTVLAAVLLWIGLWAGDVERAHLGVIPVAMGGMWWIARYVKERFEEYAVTGRRVISKRGIVRRTVSITPLERIQSIDVKQGLLGRLLNYGAVVVYTAAESHGSTGRACIKAPEEWRKQVSIAVEARKVQAGPRDGGSLPADGGRSAGDRLRTLESLLNDGLVSPMEYERKRRELLEKL